MNHQIKHLHPTLKACKCGFVGTRTGLLNHMGNQRRQLKLHGDSPREFYVLHGEVPLNEGDPRTTPVGLSATLEHLKQQTIAQ